MNSKKFHLKNFGCQMNKLDSGLLFNALSSRGYVHTDKAGEADVIIINTCSVRQHAEDRVLSHLGHIKHLKKTHPALLVAVIGCMAQRLVRNICQNCKAQFKPDYDEITALGLAGYIARDQMLWKGRGCDHCRQTGYYGRTGIFEILPYDTEVKEAIRRNVDLADLRSLVRRKGVRSLMDDGMERVIRGVTTYEEVLRVAGGSID